MTTFEMTTVLAGVTLTHPVSIDDVSAVRDALGGTPEVYRTIREMVVRTYNTAGRHAYRYTVPIEGAPPMKGRS